MSTPLGSHVVKAAYGLWLPIDIRTPWNAEWDDRVGSMNPDEMDEEDPVRRRMMLERLRYDEFQFNNEMIESIRTTIRTCVERSAGGISITAFSLEATHVHLLVPFAGRDIHRTMQYLTEQTSKAVKSSCAFFNPLWGRDDWDRRVFDEDEWEAAKQLIESRNTSQGLPARLID